jgi:hypothetical protein
MSKFQAVRAFLTFFTVKNNIESMLVALAQGLLCGFL